MDIKAQRKHYRQRPIVLEGTQINRLVKSSLGPPPYHGQNKKTLEAFNDLLLLLRREEQVRAPQVITHVPLGVPYTTGMREGDEVLANSLGIIYEQFLASPPDIKDADMSASGLTKEDLLAAQAIFVLLASGDVLVQYPARAVANFRTDALQSGNPATMLCLHDRQMRRWPISPLSLICLLRLLSLVPKPKRKEAYFFGDRFFEMKNIAPGKRVRKAKREGGRILLHAVFSKWLGIMADRCGVPKLNLQQTVKAARILAQLGRSPLVVEHLSRKARSAAIDYQSWESFLLGFAMEPKNNKRRSTGIEQGRSTQPAIESSGGQIQEGTISSVQDAFDQARAEILVLPAQPTDEQRQIAAQNLLKIASTEPLLGSADGDDAMLGNTRAALVYLAHRLYKDEAGKKTLNN